MKKILVFFLICFTLYAQEIEKQEDTQENKTQKTEQTEELSVAQKLWGRKFQAGLGYTYFNTGHHGLQLSYGMWDLNKMGILADIIFPITYTNKTKLYLVSFFWVWDWAPIKILSLMPKIGYGAKIYQTQSGDYLSWEPTMGLDLTFNINSFVKIYTSYTWAMFKNQNKNLVQLHGGSLGLRIAY